MTINYCIDRSLQLVKIKADGETSAEDLIENQKKALKDSDFEKGFNIYVDFSTAEPSPTVDIDKIKISKEFVASIQEQWGKSKCAVYAPSGYAYSFSKMYAALSKGLLINTRVFKDKRKAYEWLNIKEDS